MNQLFSFTSRCPKCGRERVIELYSGELLRLLELGYPIEARCTECNVHWPIPPQARIQIARVVAPSFQHTILAAFIAETRDPSRAA